MEKVKLCEKCGKNPDLESCSRKEQFDMYFCCIRKKNGCFECLVSDLLDKRKELMKYANEMKLVDQELDFLNGLKRTYVGIQQKREEHHVLRAMKKEWEEKDG